MIGCGESGLLAAIRLQLGGIPYTVIEKNSRPGWNLVGEQLSRRPGGRRQPLLLLQLRALDHWSEYFARQPELQAYFADVMHRHGVEKNVGSAPK